MSSRFAGADGFAGVVPLRRVPIRDEVRAVRARYERAHGRAPTDQGGWYHEADWHRISFVLDALRPGGRFLDVGVGAGQFVNAVAATSAFDEVHGVDRSRFSKYTEFAGPIERVDASVDQLPYPDDHFDVVTCMEVLEHVEDDVLEAGLCELRRVCRGQLVMSVPFEEPEPIYEGHRRRFGVEDLVRTFPLGTRCLLFRPIAPWAVVEETHARARDGDAPAGGYGLASAVGRHGRAFTDRLGRRLSVRMTATETAHRALRRIRSVRARSRSDRRR
jgi:2-polyprenyl-3-methyl-5-hydroxy-6-metoxy-1,4-benzoquinol methylase